MTEQQMNDQWAFVQTEPMESAMITDSEGFTVGYIVGAGMDPKKSAAELAERIVQEHNAVRESHAPGFRVGQRVKKVTGEYHISGEVRSVFTKADGVVRLVVEHQAEGGGSFLHVYGPNNLEAVPS